MELDELLVFLGNLELGEVFTNDVLHLYWVEVLLVGHHVPKSSFDVFNLLKLDKEHLIELFEVLLHIIISHTAIQLGHYGVDASLELSAVLSDLLVVLFVGLGVLLEPVLGVVDHLVHPLLVSLMFGLNLPVVHSNLSKQLLKLQLCLQKQLLRLSNVFLILVKFLL